MNLYNIGYAIENFFEENLDLETGELRNEEQLEALFAEKNAKIETVALFYKNLNSDVEQLEKEKKIFEERIAATKKKAEKLKNILTIALDGEKFNSSKVAISYRKSSAVEIAPNTKLPEEYLTYKEPTPNKTELKKAIQSGTVIEGVSIVEKNNIQIK